MTSVAAASALIRAPACASAAPPFPMATSAANSAATSAAAARYFSSFARPSSLSYHSSAPLSAYAPLPAQLILQQARLDLSLTPRASLSPSTPPSASRSASRSASNSASQSSPRRVSASAASTPESGPAESEEVKAAGTSESVDSDTDAFSETESVSATNGSATNGVAASASSATSSESNASGEGGASGEGDAGVPIELEFVPLAGFRKLGAQLKMLVEWPWRRVKKNSVLYMRLKGNIPEMVGSSFSPSLSLPVICDNLRKAAVDPRVSALLLHVDPLQCGWGKLQEIARHVAHFRKSGKPCIAYMTVGGEQEYFIASACEEIYAPPGAYLSLRGLAVQGQFLGGVLQKAGVQPQIERIGKYKSAGDQLARSDMSEPNREMLTAILDDFYSTWTAAVAENRGVGQEAVQQLLQDGVQEVEELKSRGFLTDVIYGIQVEELLKERLGQDKEKPLQSVDAKKYGKVSPATVGLGGKERIAVLRAVGAITQGKERGGGMGGGGVKGESIIEKLRMVKENKQFKALVLRIDSPGGDALASDLMWNEIRELAKVKPVVACMSDVAASGGYYMAMAAPHIVAEPLTLTGSIGVVTGKFSLGELYGRIGFNKEIISRGRFAELNADQRPFTPDEEEYFAKGAKIAYQRFRNKAALSRSMEEEDMEAVAQGRVWTGQAAHKAKLVDSLGGFWTAVQVAKSKAGIDLSQRVRIVELSRSQPSITALLSGGAQSVLALSGFFGPEARAEALRSLAADLLLSPSLGASFGASLGSSGTSFGNLLSGGIDASMSGVHITGSSGTINNSLNTVGVQAVMEGDITVRGSGSDTAAAIYSGAGGSAGLAELAVLLSPAAAALGGALGQSSDVEEGRNTVVKSGSDSVDV
ncbi:unnamed protein product [Closterium sp. Yama58-4]|nr:unnamed protein product [Closterium sp. Yama58-4]